MSGVSRREALQALTGAAVTAGLGRPASPEAGRQVTVRRTAGAYDPWLELDPEALRHNAGEVSTLAGNRPILGVVKNNAYGLGLEAVGPLLDRLPGIAGLAVVKADEAIRLRDAGVRKPILVMGLVSEE